MALDIHNQRAGSATADKINLSVLLWSTSSTLHQAEIAIPLGRSTSETWTVLIVDSVEDEEEEWDTLFALPHVQAGLSRLANEAERQFALGETEEGGFAVE